MFLWRKLTDVRPRHGIWPGDPLASPVSTLARGNDHDPGLSFPEMELTGRRKYPTSALDVGGRQRALR